MERYSRNRIYIPLENQDKIRQARILLAGAGIGSIIAECALRLGFEKITIIDGDKVELSNLNRQNYTVADIGQYKAEALCRRLKSINPDADIRHVNAFINEDNVKDMVDGCDIAVNALDFKDRTPFVFDEVCSGKGIPVLHPYNFGWSGFLTVVRSKDRMLAELSSSPEGFELQVAEFAARHCASQDKRNQELEDVIRRYRTEKGQLPPPQLAIGSWLTAGLCVNAMYNITVGKPVNYFPQFYLSSMAVMDGEAPRSC